jgi:hypothetical protein
MHAAQQAHGLAWACCKGGQAQSQKGELGCSHPASYQLDDVVLVPVNLVVKRSQRNKRRTSARRKFQRPSTFQLLVPFEHSQFIATKPPSNYKLHMHSD